jgi:hypothetical protein
MATPNDLKSIFNEASAAILQSYENNSTPGGGKATPSQLIDAINKFFIIYEKLGVHPGQNNVFSRDAFSQIGDQAISCLIELGSWAERLNLHREKAMLDEIALAAAHWVIKHQAEILNLEVIVNLLAAKANQTSDKIILTALFHVINDVIEYASAEFKNDLDKSDPSRPWRMLNFNFAIVATRTANKKLMVKAFDTLGRNLPEDCPHFFEEGIKQSQKEVYGPEIKMIMAEYFKKWATLH